VQGDREKHLIVRKYQEELYIRAKAPREWYEPTAWDEEAQDVEEWFGHNEWQIQQHHENVLSMRETWDWKNGKKKKHWQKRWKDDDVACEEPPKKKKLEEEFLKKKKPEEECDNGEREEPQKKPDDDDEEERIFGPSPDKSEWTEDEEDGMKTRDGIAEDEDAWWPRKKRGRGNPDRPGRRGQRSTDAVLARADQGRSGVGAAKARTSLVLAGAFQTQAQGMLTLAKNAT